ncbi:MAG: transcriptional repressor, partial [Candidatus Eisenbacteria bacterium]|nr:transcriptional repressor [Candidatus Eisenbacteria bacterium]
MRLQEPEIRQRVQRFREACTAARVRLTHQRLEIFREVAGTGDHPDVEAIWRAVRKRIPTVSLDTVYRTLWLLNDVGAITTLGLPRERIRFDANTTPHHH